MKSFHWTLVGAVLVGLVVAGLAANGFFSNDTIQNVELNQDGPESESVKKPQRSPDKPLRDSLGLGESDEMKKVGGIDRPARDLNFEDSTSKDPQLPSTLFDHPGNAPSLQGDENPQVAQLKKDVEGKDYLPEALSTYTLAKDFDRELFKRDPETYVNNIRPGRVFEPAQPKEGVTRISTDMPRYKSILQGESVVFTVKVDPGMPVTFYTPAVGEFANRLTTQTVVANEQGVATATYKAGLGTKGLTNILAASPVHSGQLRFTLNVALPENATSEAN